MASDSHNQPTTSTRGGASSVATPANSGSQGIFGGSSIGQSHGNGESKETAPSRSEGSGGETRNRQDGGGLFGNLSNLKRDSQDQGTAARKSSMQDQGNKPGIIGQAWNTFTQGSGTGN